MLALWTSIALAGAPLVGAVMEPDDVVEQYREHAQSKGLSAAESELLCKTAAEGVQICATVLESTGWRYASHADVEVKRPTATLSGTHAGFKEKSVDGMGRYWVRNLNDGREGLIFTEPSVLKRLAPVELVVAWPQPGVVIAWVPGNPNLDQVVAVGVVKMFEASNHPISSKLYKHDGKEWVVWGEAKKEDSR